MNWLVGEYGDTLRVVMPFEIDGTVTLKVRKPAETAWVTWTADVVELSAVEHVVVAGDLNRVGTYRGVVEVVAGQQLRKAIFSFEVSGLGLNRKDTLLDSEAASV